MRIVSMLLLPLVIAAMVAIADYGVAEALPVKPQPLSAVAPASNIGVRSRPWATRRSSRPWSAWWGSRPWPVWGSSRARPIWRSSRAGPLWRKSSGRPALLRRRLVRHWPALLERPMVAVWRRIMLAGEPDRIRLGSRITFPGTNLGAPASCRGFFSSSRPLSFGALVGYDYPHSAARIASGRALLVDRAKILVMRLRQIGRGRVGLRKR